MINVALASNTSFWRFLRHFGVFYVILAFFTSSSASFTPFTESLRRFVIIYIIFDIPYIVFGVIYDILALFNRFRCYFIVFGVIHESRRMRRFTLNLVEMSGICADNKIN